MTDVVLRHIVMRSLPANPKTKRWQVVTKAEGALLGSIGWFGRWRRYAFTPYEGSVYEQDCLRDIASFIEAQTKAHREAA